MKLILEKAIKYGSCNLPKFMKSVTKINHSQSFIWL